MESLNQKGFIFSTEIIAGLAILSLAIATIAILAESPFEQANPQKLQQTKVILNAQTDYLSNTTAIPYTGPNDYYCYQLYGLEIGPGKTMTTNSHCEETE